MTKKNKKLTLYLDEEVIRLDRENRLAAMLPGRFMT